MAKIWYCPSCGYEVRSRGRCHLCRQRLVASSLPELEEMEEEDEVGYRLEGWSDRDRGRLIEQLNATEVLHRFEEDELVVAADDEERTDDLVAEVAATAVGETGGQETAGGAGWRVGDASEVGVGATGGAPAGGAGEGGVDTSWLVSAVRLLADAARRLSADPTDMQADADVAEASAAVFLADSCAGVDPETWAAIGRVTRRLLAALGAEEALDDEIRIQGAVLVRLMEPVAAAGRGGAPAPATGTLAGAEAGAGGVPAPERGTLPADEETVYELPDWLPEQRVQLEVMLDEAGIVHEWDGGDLVVPAAAEETVESLFDAVGETALAGEDDDDGTERYHALEELFAAAGRLAGEPDDEGRAADFVFWVHEVEGPPPLGMDEVLWLRIMKDARALVQALEAGGGDLNALSTDAGALRDLLRSVV